MIIRPEFVTPTFFSLVTHMKKKKIKFNGGFKERDKI